MKPKVPNTSSKSRSINRRTDFFNILDKLNNIIMFLENNINQKNQLGWIEVICGSMFSGKTEELIRRLKGRIC